MSTVVILNVSFLFFQTHLPDWPFFSLSFYGAAPGAMANHLISNALLRPHGTNNPYNTLLGEPAVCNNPSVSMYNAQGVLEFILIFSSESPILCSFYGHIFLFFLLPFLSLGSRHTDFFHLLPVLVLLFSIFLRFSLVRNGFLPSDKHILNSPICVCFSVMFIKCIVACHYFSCCWLISILNTYVFILRNEIFA